MERHTTDISGVYAKTADQTDPNKYSYVSQLSVKDKIALICSDCTTNAELLDSIKNTGLKLTKQQSVFILKSFTPAIAYDPRYMSTLTEMGFDLIVLPDLKLRYDLGISHVRYDETCILYQVLHEYRDYKEYKESGTGGIRTSIRGFDCSLIRLIYGEPFLNRYYKLIKNEEYNSKSNKTISSKRLKWIEENQASCKDEFEQHNLDLLCDLLNVLGDDVKVQGFCTGNLIGFYKAAIQSQSAAKDAYINKIHHTIRLLVQHGLNLNSCTKIVEGYRSGSVVYGYGNLVELLCKSIEESDDYVLNHHFIQLLLVIYSIPNYKYVPSHSTLNAYVSLIRIGMTKYGMGKDTDAIKTQKLEHLLTYSTLLEKILVALNENDDFTSFVACTDYVMESGSMPLLDIFLRCTPRIKTRIEELNSMSRSYYSKYVPCVAEKGYYDMMKVLLSINADVDYVSSGDTALKIACRLGDLSMATLLLDNGANITIFDSVFMPYRSILNTARSTIWRNDELVNLLEKQIAQTKK